jgi:hypothetical protein
MIVEVSQGVPAVKLRCQRRQVVPLGGADPRQQGHVDATGSGVPGRLHDERLELRSVESLLRRGEDRGPRDPARPPGVADHLLDAV